MHALFENESGLNASSEQYVLQHTLHTHRQLHRLPYISTIGLL
jgi:hypothetical protein